MQPGGPWPAGAAAGSSATAWETGSTRRRPRRARMPGGSASPRELGSGSSVRSTGPEKELRSLLLQDHRQDLERHPATFVLHKLHRPPPDLLVLGILDELV